MPLVAETITETDRPRQVKSLVVILLTVSLGALLIVAIGLLRFGSVSLATRYLQGYKVVPEIDTLSVHDIVPGDRATYEFKLHNLTSRYMRVVGAEADCGCTACEDLPINLDPRSVASMRVSFVLSRPLDIGTVRHKIRLLFNEDSPPVFLTAEAFVKDSAAKATTEDR